MMPDYNTLNALIAECEELLAALNLSRAVSVPCGEGSLTFCAGRLTIGATDKERSLLEASLTERLAAAKCMGLLFDQAHAQSHQTANEVDEAVDCLQFVLDANTGKCPHCDFCPECGTPTAKNDTCIDCGWPECPECVEKEESHGH